MKKFYFLSLIVALGIIFSSSAWVKLTLMRPAVISVPLSVQTLLIVDRTLPSDEKRNKVEEVLTGEIMRQDEQGVQAAIDGLVKTLQNGPRFKTEYSNDKYMGETSGTIFPQAMNWTTIDKLCEKYRTDAVLAIETYDSDYIITNGSRLIDHKDANGNIKKVMEFFAEGVGSVNLGFRLYFPAERSIGDQYQFSRQMRWDASGSSVTAAVQGVMDKIAAINEVSYEAGREYALRISPSYYTVTRYFYDKPKKNKHLVAGVRKSEVADWKGAIESWEMAIKKGKKDKDKGRAAFNIAVGYEVLGDFDKALEWASKSYTEYGEKDANDYYKAIRARLNEEAIVNNQLGKD
jgi:tetratricopeptide (TPR) repeat protein